MTTMTAPVRNVKPTRILMVAGEPFEVRHEVPPHKTIRSWMLTSLQNRAETLLHRTQGGAIFCTCRALEIDCQGGCIHSAALEAAGMFDEPAPEFEPAPSLCPECGHAHDQADPDAWPSPAPDDDELVLTVPDDDGPRLTLEEALQEIKAGYAALDTDLGDLLATTIGELLSEVRLTGARDVATLLDRRACLGS